MYKSVIIFSILIVGSVIFWALQPEDPSPTPAVVAASVSGSDADDKLKGFFTEVFERDLNKSPERLANLGRPNELQGLWDDRSDAKEQQDSAVVLADLARLQSEFNYADLSDQAKLSFELFVYNAENRIRTAGFRYHNYVLDQFRGQVAGYLTLLQNNHPIKDTGDAEDYISRITGLEAIMDEFVAQLQDREGRGIITPVFSFADMITDIEKISSGAPIADGEEDNVLYADFKRKLDALALDDRQKQSLLDRASDALKGPYAAGVGRLLAELKRLQPLSKGNFGVWSLPNGKAYYESRIKSATTLDLSADEIHQIGLDDVARIHEEMKAIMQEVGFEGDLQAFFAFIRADPNNYYENNDAGRAQFLAEAQAETDAIFAIAPQYFNKLPKAAIEVRRVEPWRENSTSIAFYNRPSEDGSRPGIYYANMKDMTNFQKYVFKAITFHEGVPGHHFQAAMAQELEGLPMFRKFGWYNAYGEGWALYAERLAKEMGFYQDPYHNFGRLQDEIWRSVRLVVDTGIHAKRWTREQAIAYFQKNTPISEGDIVTEVERYFVNPGQALGYKMGMIKILELRQKATTALGDKFDIRFFHDAVLQQGSLPLPVLEKQVERYIAATLAGE